MKVNGLSGGHVNSRLDSSVALSEHIAPYSNMNNRLDGQGIVGTANGQLPTHPRYPHIKDLQARAEAATPKSLSLTPVNYFFGLFYCSSHILIAHITRN